MADDTRPEYPAVEGLHDSQLPYSVLKRTRIDEGYRVFVVCIYHSPVLQSQVRAGDKG